MKKRKKLNQLSKAQLVKHIREVDRSIALLEAAFTEMAGEREKAGLPDFFRETDRSRARVLSRARDLLWADLEDERVVIE